MPARTAIVSNSLIGLLVFPTTAGAEAAGNRGTAKVRRAPDVSGSDAPKTKPASAKLRRVRRALAGFITRPQAVDQIGARVGTLLSRRRVCQCSCSRALRRSSPLAHFLLSCSHT